jgi:hypothetical protein
MLEDRRLLSVVPAVAAAPAASSAEAARQEVVTLDWKGHQVEAKGGEWILGLSPKADLVRGKRAAAQVRAVERRLGAAGAAGASSRVEEQLGRSGQFLLSVPQSLGYEQVLASVKNLPGFQYLEPNAVLRLQATTANR